MSSLAKNLLMLALFSAYAPLACAFLSDYRRFEEWDSDSEDEEEFLVRRSEQLHEEQRRQKAAEDLESGDPARIAPVLLEQRDQTVGKTELQELADRGALVLRERKAREQLADEGFGSPGDLAAAQLRRMVTLERTKANERRQIEGEEATTRGQIRIDEFQALQNLNSANNLLRALRSGDAAAVGKARQEQQAMQALQQRPHAFDENYDRQNLTTAELNERAQLQDAERQARDQAQQAEQARKAAQASTLAANSRPATSATSFDPASLRDLPPLPTRQPVGANPAAMTRPASTTGSAPTVKPAQTTRATSASATTKPTKTRQSR